MVIFLKKALQDKYLPAFIILLLFFATPASGQGYNRLYSNYEWNRGRFALGLRPPMDTTATADSGSLAIIDGTIYVKKGYWLPVTGGAAAFDSTSLSRRIDQKQDLLGFTPVPNTRLINGKPLSGDITLGKDDIGLPLVPNVDATNPANIRQSSDFRFVTDGEKAGIYGSVKTLSTDTTQGTLSYVKNDGSTGTLYLPKGGGGGGTVTPANYANSYFDDAQAGTYNGPAQVSADGNTVYGLLDNNTGELTTWTKTTKYIDGTDMIDSKVDGVVYRKKGISYYKRVYEGPILAKWFCKPDGTTDNTLQLQKAYDLIGAAGGGTLLFSNGIYTVTPTTARDKCLVLSSNTTTEFTKDATLKVGANDLVDNQIFYINQKNNITFRGITVIGDRAIHIGTTGEGGYAIYISSGSTNIKILNSDISDMWGDAVYVGGTLPNKDILIDGCVFDNCRRNGVSITYADGVTITNTVSKNINGNPAGPCAGFDLEPTSLAGGGTTWVRNVRLSNIGSYNNTGSGLTSTSDNVVASNLDIRFNGYGILFSGLGITNDENSGFNLNNSVIENNRLGGVNVQGASGKVSVANTHISANGGDLVFAVSGITTIPAAGDTYNIDGNIYTVKSASITSGSGTINFYISRALGKYIPFSGILTREKGTGDASITYSNITTTNNIFGVYITSPNGVSFENCLILNNAGRGVYAAIPNNQPVSFKGCTISGNFAGSTFTGSNLVFADNTVRYNNNVQNGTNMSSEGAVTINGSYSTVVGNAIYKNQGTGLYLWGHGNVVNSNNIYANSLAGNGLWDNIRVGGGAANNSIQNNVINKWGADITFTVAGISTVPTVGAGYTVGNTKIFVRSANLSGTAPNISGTIIGEPFNQDSAIKATGTLTKYSGTGDANITYSAFSAIFPGYGILLRSGAGTNNIVKNNGVVGQMGVTDILDQQTGNIKGSTGGVTDHGALTGLLDDDHPQYLNVNGRSTSQKVFGNSGSTGDLILGSNPNLSGKIYFGTGDKRSFFDEPNKQFFIDSNFVWGWDGSKYALQLYPYSATNVSKYAMSNVGTKFTGTTGGWALGQSFEDYAHNNLGGFGGYGSGSTLNYLWIGKTYDTAWIKANSAATEITNKLRLPGTTYNGSSALAVLVQDTLTGDVYRQMSTQKDYSIGTQPEAYGADADSTTRDDNAIQAAINAAGVNGIIQLKRGTTYLMKNSISLLPGQTLVGYGARLKHANEIVTTTTTAITTGSSPTNITVASAAGLEVGMKITVTGGPNGVDGDYVGHTITAINGNVITVSSNFTKAFPSGGTVVTNYGVINISGTNDRIKIYGLEIDGNRDNNLTYCNWQTDGLITFNGAQVVVRDCYLHDGQSDGIMMGGSGPIADNNRILRMGGNGIHLSGVTGAKVTNNYVNYCTLAITGTNNNTGPSHAEGTMTWSNLISHTLVDGNYFGNARAMLGVIDGTDNNDNTITNNTGENFSLYTIEYKDGTGVNDNSLKNLIFANNRIYNGGKMYFNNNGSTNDVYDAANRSFIVANNLFDHTSIEVTRGKDFRINDNIFDFKGDSVTTIVDIYSSSNFSTNNNTLLHGQIGVRFTGGNPVSGKDWIGANGSIADNNFREQYLSAVKIATYPSVQYRNVSVTGNTVIQNRTYLTNYIGVDGANGVRVESNKLDLKSGKYGINTAGDVVASNYGTIGTIVRLNWINTPPGTPSVRISGGNSRNVVEMNAIYQAISNGQPANNFVQDNVYDTLAVGYSSTPTGGATTFDALTDVNITGKVNGSIPKWNSSTSKWEMGVDNTGSGSPVWGSITGTLSSQTDLQNALNAKENSFTKNTGFNLPIGTTAGTVAAGDDSRIVNGQTAYGWGNHASQGYLKNITGLVSAGTNVTLSGTGTLADPYVINAAGGGSGGVSLSANNTWTGVQSFNPSITLPSGIGYGAVVAPTVNNSGTSGYTGLFVSPFVSTTGSGSNKLLDIGYNSAANAGGTHTSVFSIGKDASGQSPVVFDKVSAFTISGQTTLEVGSGNAKMFMGINATTAPSAFTSFSGTHLYRVGLGAGPGGAGISSGQTYSSVYVKGNMVSGQADNMFGLTVTPVTNSGGIATNAATLFVDGASANATNSYGIWVKGTGIKNKLEGSLLLPDLSGTGSRMLVANDTGLVSTQAIPTYTFNSLGTSADGFNIYDGAVGNQQNFRRIFPGNGVKMNVLANGYGVSISTTPAATAYTILSAAPSSNYTVSQTNSLVKLPDLTSQGIGMTLVIPSANGHDGERITVFNMNTNVSYKWEFSGATVMDAGGNVITFVPNGAPTQLVSDGTNWLQIN